MTTRCVRYSTESKSRRLDALPEHRRATALPAQGCRFHFILFLFLLDTLPETREGYCVACTMV